MKFFVYILYNKLYDKFYIGQTYSLKKRITEHKQKLANYTSRYDGEWIFVYYEQLDSRAEAMAREKYFKTIKNKESLKNFIRIQRKG